MLGGSRNTGIPKYHINYFTTTHGIYGIEITFRFGVHPQDISVHKYKFKKIAGCCGSEAEHLTGMQENLASITSLETHTYIHKKLLSLRKNIMYQIKQKFKSKIVCSLAYYIMNTQLTLALFIFHICLILTLDVC